MKTRRWTSEEKRQLHWICESGWDWEFPGYKWVAQQLSHRMNDLVDNYVNRSTRACREMDKKISKQKHTI